MTEKRRTLYFCWTMQLNMILIWIIAIMGITNADRELFSCDFERQCSPLNQERTDDYFDWTLHNGVTDQWFTGPSSDHTVGDDTGHYFYAKSEIESEGKTAKIFFPCYDLTQETAHLEFYYHMYDARYPDNMGTLNVYAQPCGDGAVPDKELVFTRDHNQGYLWKKGEADIQGYSKIKITFEAIRGGTESDIAIDDITLMDIFDNTNPGATVATQQPFTEDPITNAPPVRTTPQTARPPVVTPVNMVSTLPTTRRKPTTTPPTPEVTTKVSSREPPRSVPTPMKTKDRGDDNASLPTTTGSTAIWGPPSRTLGDTAIIGAAVAVGVMCVLILILIVLVWKTRRGKSDDQRRGEMYENQAFNRSQDIHQCNHHNDPAYTALHFPRGRSMASTIAAHAAPDPPKRHRPSSGKQNGKGKYIGLRKPGQYQDSSLSKHSMGISTISTTRSANSNDFGSTMEGHIGVYEAVPINGQKRRGRGGRRGGGGGGGPGMPRRTQSEMLGNPVYIGGSEGDLQISSCSKLPTSSSGCTPGCPLEPKYYTVLPDVVDTLHYKVRVSKIQTLPSHARTWHINDHYPESEGLSEDSDIDVGSKESVYADIEDTPSSLSDYSAGETVGNNIYGPYEIEC